MPQLMDPRRGDVEDDASSTKRRSLLAIAGSLLTEISLPRLVASWILLILLPALLLGLAPLVVTAWLRTFSQSVAASVGGIWSVLVLVVVIAVGWFGGRRLFRVAEQGFWSLNSIAVQPAYALCREGLRHLSELSLNRWLDEGRRARLRAACAACAGVLLCALALLAIWLVWPWTRWQGELSDLAEPLRFIVPMLANAVAFLCAYCAAAALLWGIADATMDQPRDFTSFGDPSQLKRAWRVAHLSDIHIVGERYGFRIESGRAGPCGNGRLAQVLERLAAIHEKQPLDHILITGDVTDAGRSTEWAEFATALLPHPALAERIAIIPGNHDINIVDRANPARLDLPTSPGPRLREMRSLSAIAALQASRFRVFDPAKRQLGTTLERALEPHRSDIATFADTGTIWLMGKLAKIWAEAFPLVLPPDTEDGLGIILLNSTAQTHFSFTNALGLVSTEQSLALHAVARQFPQARWLVALHHHVVEYPNRAKAFSERIGTALINGSWFVRQLQRLSDRIIVLHGHRHIDWIGHCGGLRILSAPSPVMESTGENTTYFYIHTFGVDREGQFTLLVPERIDIEGILLPAQAESVAAVASPSAPEKSGSLAEGG